MTATTPMLRQYKAIKEQHKDALLFFRLGDFYEMFFDDALTGARELEITLTKRDGGNGKKIPMCGVPYHAAENYIARLIDKGYKVAICEQVEDPKLAKGIVKRDIVRVITPGTVIDATMLKENKANYLLAVYRTEKDNAYGLAYTDITTGEFMATVMQGEHILQKLSDEIGRIQPAEVILPPKLYKDEIFRLGVFSYLDTVVTEFAEDAPIEREYQAILLDHFHIASLESLGLAEIPSTAMAAALILAFLQQTQKQDLYYLNTVQLYQTQAFMLLDASTRRNLELVETIRKGERKGSLLWVCDQTCTALGARLLKQWIEKPLLDTVTINCRLSAVEELGKSPFLADDLRQALKNIYDLERLIGRVCYGNASPRDFIALKNSLAELPKLQQILARLNGPFYAQLFEELDLLEDIYQLIDQAIVADPPLSPKEGGIIKDGFAEEIDELRKVSLTGKSWLTEMEAKEKAETGIRSLKVGFNKVFGYYLEVTKANLSLVPDYYIRKQTTVGGERYITQELKEWEDKILGAKDKLAALEYQIFTDIRQKIALNAVRIQQTASVIARLDVIQSLSKIAQENGYCRPVIDDGDVIEIKEGRHPVIEKIIGLENYIANDVYLDNTTQQLMLITGPNMAGKSTYMRQVALCVLLARIGSFVPAKSARIGKIDRIFTRVGASDDLAAGQSTFMVEMCETSNILRNATRNSLIILDEIGRGTSTYDGLSIAWSVSEYLLNPKIGAKTLFATHYHELVRLAEEYEQVKNFYVAVREKDGTIIFLRKILPGGIDKSYGIQVARLAGLPEEVLRRAKQILTLLESKEESPAVDLAGLPAQVAEDTIEQNASPELEALSDEIAQLDLNQMTPLAALLQIEKWQKAISAVRR